MKLSKEFHLDIDWWLLFLRDFNGKVAIKQRCPVMDIQVDACNKASGIFFRGDWSYIHFASDHPEAASLHINHKETLSVLYAARKWAPFWADCDVIIHSDSTVACAVLNKGTSRNPVVMSALRELFWWSVTFNFQIKAVHIPGKLNMIADSISRLHEKGQFAYLNSLLPNGISPTFLPVHMSKKAFYFLSPQIRRWSTWQTHWTKR
jgi:hypothetical protein